MTTKVIIVGRETFLSSLTKDIFAVLLFGSLIGLGILADSPAMQWAGFLIAAFVVTGVVKKLMEKQTYTIDEARKELDRMEKEARDD